MSMDSILSSLASNTLSSEAIDITAVFFFNPGNFLWGEINASETIEIWSEIIHNTDVWTIVDTQASSETWSEITHNAGTWTEVDAGGTIQTWKKVA